MTLIELIIFILHLVCGFFVGKYFWNNFGYIYSPIGFVLGIFAFYCLLQFLAFLENIIAKFKKGKTLD